MTEKPPKNAFSVVSGLPVRVPDPPQPLGPAGRALWNAVMGEYGITDTGGTTMLMMGCLAYDRSERLRAQIDADGEIIKLRNGSIRAHPAIKDEINCRAQVMRAIEKLGLNYEAIKPVGRPPPNYGGPHF